jgi:hypothetical protein
MEMIVFSRFCGCLARAPRLACSCLVFFRNKGIRKPKPNFYFILNLMSSHILETYNSLLKDKNSLEFDIQKLNESLVTL